MLKNNVLGLIMGLTVGVILLGSLVAPTITAMTDSTRTYTNDGVTFAEYDGEEHTIVVSYDADSNIIITTDGESVDVPDLSLYSGATIVYGDSAFVRLLNGSVQVYSSLMRTVLYSADDPVTITVSSTGVTAFNSSVSRSAECDVLAYISPVGNYVLSVNPRVTDDTIIIAGVTAIDSSDRLAFYGYGTVENLSVSTGYISSSESLTVSSVSAAVNTTEIDGELVRIDSIVFTAVMSDDTEWSGTYTYFLAPMTVIYDNPDYIGDALAPIMLAIIVILIIGLVMMASRGITRD